MQKKKTKTSEIDLVIFDVNQTMFSLNALNIKFKEFGLKQSLGTEFSKMRNLTIRLKAAGLDTNRI